MLAGASYVPLSGPKSKLLTLIPTKVIGAYCEKRDPYLAFLAYKRGLCDVELVDLTNRHGLFKQQAREPLPQVVAVLSFL